MRRLIGLVLIFLSPLSAEFPDICSRCWYEVPNSNLDTVLPSPIPPGWSGPHAIMGNNGGAFDTRRSRLIVTGGGGRDYSGNDVYAFDLDSLKWYRIKDGATVYDEYDSLSAYYFNGDSVPDEQQPRPGYNYDQIEYDSTTDNLFILGAPYAATHGYGWNNIFQLNLGSLTWSHPADVHSRFHGGNVSARDPSTGKIWFYGNSEIGWTQSFNPGTGVMTDHGNMWTGGWISSFQTAAIMPSTNRMIAIGGGAATYWDIVTSGVSSPTTLETTGCDSLLAIDNPGFEWDPVQRKLVGWARGTQVITMDSTYTCHVIASNDSNNVTPSPPNQWGTYGRWRYVPKYNVFVVVNTIDSNVYLYRPSDGTGTGSPGSPPVVVITSPSMDTTVGVDSILVLFTVDAVADSQIHALAPGVNQIILSSTNGAGTGKDTVNITRDIVAPGVVITSPVTGSGFIAAPITIHWSIDGVGQTIDTLQSLVEGSNTVIRSDTDAVGNIGADTITVVLDTQGPMVVITSPSSGLLTNMTSIAVAWTVGGVTQTTGMSESLVEGVNTVRRSATDSLGNVGRDSILVTRDTQAPVVVITSPANGAGFSSTPVPVAWTVDGVGQSTELSASLSLGANLIIRDSTDAAGNTGSDTVTVTLYECVVVEDDTLYINSPQSEFCLVIKDDGVVMASRKLTSHRIVIENGGVLSTDDSVLVDTLILESGGLVTHSALAVGHWDRHVHILAAFLKIDSGASIDASYKGFPGGIGPDGQVEANANIGGSHGGRGRSYYPAYSSFQTYGNYLAPITAGSGGGLPGNGDDYSGPGGGIIRLEADSLILEGTILANGRNGIAGSGAGGSVWLSASGYSGGGSISANGGVNLWGTGGGGRVAIYGCGIPQNLLDSIKVSGFQNGSIYKACYDNPLVAIVSPLDSMVIYNDTAKVVWTAEGSIQATDTLEALNEGWNTISRCFTNAFSHTGCDTVHVRVDLNPPVVVITSPGNGTYSSAYTVNVSWTVDGVPQITQLTATLAEGPNKVIRFFKDSQGSVGADTVVVTLDTHRPEIELIHPQQSAMILGSEMDLRWMVDGVEQEPVHHVMDTSGANRIRLTAVDSAGNVDTLLAFFYSGSAVPDIIGQNHFVADTILTSAGLAGDTTWADNDTVATGLVFAQSPSAGDSLRYHWPVQYRISRGTDAVDLVPVLVKADSVIVDPLTLAASGRVQVFAVNQGRAALEDSFSVLVFEDRNRDERFTQDSDLVLGSTMNSVTMEAGDTLEIAVMVNGGLVFNGNRISVLLDYGDSITEYHEDNNYANSMANCRKPPLVMDFTPKPLWHWTTEDGIGSGSVHTLPLTANFTDDNEDGLINEEDVPDVVVQVNSLGHCFGDIQVLDGSDGQVVWKKAVNPYGLSDPAVGDIDGDGKPEIVFIQASSNCSGRRIVVLDHLGNVKATGESNFQGVSGYRWEGVILSDLDADGKSEIIWGPNVLDYRARQVFPDNYARELRKFMPYDLDGDGYQELVGTADFVNNIGLKSIIINFKAKTYSQGATNNLPYPLMVKIGADGAGSILNFVSTWDTGGKVESYNSALHLENIFPGVPISDSTYHSTSEVPDRFFFNGSGSIRDFYALGARTSCPFFGSCSTFWFASRTNLKDSSVSTLYPKVKRGGHQGTVFDLNGDGAPEIITQNSESLYVYDSAGVQLSGIEVPDHGGGNYMTVGDVNRDGHADIIVGNGSPGHNLDSGWGPVATPGVIVYSNPTWIGARAINNQEFYTITNINDDARIPRFPTRHWQANNTVNIQCTEGNYACLDASASFPQIALDDSGDFEVTARIGNGGAIDLPAGIPISVYSNLSGSTALMVSTTTTRRLKAGEYYTFHAPIPGGYRGMYEFRIAIDDSGDGEGVVDESNETNNSVTVSLMVNNHLPVATHPGDQYAEPGVPFSFDFNATDEDGDSLEYRLTRGETGMVIDSLTGLIQWTSGANPPRCSVTVSVSDPYDGTASASFIIFNGNAANLRPVITSIPDSVAKLNTIASPLETFHYAIAATDPENEALEYMIRCVDCVLPGGSLPQLTGTEINWSPFQPPWHESDSATLEVLVRDARGGLDTQTFVVKMVRAHNSAPVFAGSPVTSATEGAAWKSPITVFDLDDDAVTLRLDTVPIGMSFSSDSLRWTPTQPGNYVVRIGASDGFDTTWQRFVVTVNPTNDAPRITSLAPLRAISGALYSYPILAVDEENDALTYTLAQGPSGMTLSVGGLIEWRPSQSRTASANVEVLVADGHGGDATHAWQILMRPDSIPPAVSLRFSQNPVLPGHAVTVFVDAEDNVGLDSVKLTHNGSPVTLTSGAYTFIPSTPGNNTFLARVVDSLGHFATANGLLSVSEIADVSPPSITLTHSPSNPDAGDWVTFTVSVSDSDGVDSSRIWVAVDGLNLPVVAGTASYQALRPGILLAKAVAYDLLGASALDYDTVIVDPLGGDAVPPTASITSPEEDSLLYGRATLIGTAFDAHMAYYTLSHRDVATSTWTEYFRSTDNVQADSLGVVDATTLVNGNYEIRLDVYDRSGNSNTASVQIKAVGEKKVGPFTLAFQDLTIPMSGLDVSVSRTYDSRVKTQGEFGIGWQMGLRSIRLSENRNPGTGWTLNRSPGLIPQYSLSGANPHTVTVTLPGGRTQEFNAEPHFFSPFNPTFGVMQYTAKPGTYSTLTPVEVDTFVVFGGEFYDQNGDFQETFNPQIYRLTLLDGSYFVFDQNSGGVIESGDANGNKVEWGGNSISHNAGESIDFGRDDLGRITSISDHAGRGMQYQYDVLGNLSAVVDANGNVTKFKYGPNSYLAEIFDARGIRAARTEYDGDGRVVRQINANGDTLAMFHDLNANTETIEDYNGNVTTYNYDSAGNVLAKTDDANHTWSYAYDAAGNLLSTEQPGGGIKSSTFDAHGNELTSTDELENTLTRTYDAKGHVLSSLDAVGHLTRYEYDSKGNLEREIGPDDELVSERVYDAKGNLLKEYNALGDSTRHTYTSQGWLETTIDPLNRVTRFGYDGAGNALFEVNPLGDTTRFAYDANGNRTLTVNAAGDTSRTEYNAISKVVKQVDALGHETRFVYNNLGDKIQDIAPDSALTDREYDAQGNVKSILDPAERETRMLYDFENRLIRTTFEDDSYIRTEYDALGRRYRSIDARNNVTEYGYDAAGRNTTVTDALGRITEYEYDDVGRKTAMIDALDHRTEYEYDEYGRLILTTFADATTRGTAYDALGRKISETDQAGLTTRFYYDAVGNLKAVKSPQGDSTSYTYDANNNRLTQKDANNHTTSMAYDGLNRMVSRTYPNGNQERWTYNSNGAMLSHVKGQDSTAYEYDLRDREVYRKHFNSGHEVVTTYSLDGKRETVVDYRGTTTYSYDDRGRLAGEGHPNGDSLENHYDVQGNRTSVITPFGTTSYTYDALNRMATVVSPQSQTTRYFYDAVGNRDSVSYPNSTYTKYRYDNLNRLTYVKNQGPGGVISGYAYTLNPAGIRTGVTENDSSRVLYTYDSLYRLKSEKRSGTHPDTLSYTYDAVGNRLTQLRAGVTTTYAYNSRDQLLSEWNGSDSTRYTYDAAGRMLTKLDASGMTGYWWVDEDRLDSLTTPGPDVKYGYDAEGRRVKETVGATVKQYLIDPLLPYGQVVLETDGAGDLNAEYVYGLERVSQRRSGTSRYFLADGQGSARQLTDSIGVVTDTHFYMAFGEDLYSSGSTPHDFKYVGEHLDPNSGLYYNRARWMDPGTGRFTSVDAFEGREKEPLTLHRYLYAAASPISFVDPSGNNFSLSAQSAAIAGLGILTTATYLHIQQGHSIPNFAAPNLAVGIAMREYWDAALTVSQGFEAEAALLISELGARTKDALDKLKDLTKWQLVLQMPTELSTRRPKTYTNLPYVQMEYGGDKGRVMGARVKNKETGANNLIMRIDYHPVEKYFPGYDKTLHYHVPPNEDIHYFVWPDHVVLP